MLTLQHVQAAGVIHSDFEKGFIRAEIVAATDVKKFGSEKAVREQGTITVVLSNEVDCINTPMSRFIPQRRQGISYARK